MRFLLKFLFLLISIVAIVLIVGLFIDGNFSVSKKVTINQPKEVVFEYLALIENQQEYGVWQKKDPNIKITNEGVDGMVGFVSKWDSQVEEVGVGEQKIIKIVEDQLIETEIRFLRPMETTSQASLKITPVSPNSCTVKWTLSGESPYPWNIMMLFMNMDKEVGPDLQKGLENLKSILESQSDTQP